MVISGNYVLVCARQGRPFTLECYSCVVADIREQVLGASLATPCGGLATGGLLLGHFQNSRLTITDSIPFLCKHAYGPEFVLSETEQLYFGLTITGAKKDPDREPVGWYHSQVRDEISPSESAKTLHRQFFSEPWQVMLVTKPHARLPIGGRFFYCEPDGTMLAVNGDQEFTFGSARAIC